MKSTRIKSSPKSSKQAPFNCTVLVVGDLNRSPRMLNHCVAISENMPEVQQISLIGFNGGDIRSDIAMNKKIKLYYIPTNLNNKLKSMPRYLFFLSALLRIFIQIFSLFYLLFKVPKSKFILVQNPPGIPAILVCKIVSMLRGSKFIIDWHNYGYTIMSVNKRNKLLCKIAYWYEKIFATTSHLNFCVSGAMNCDLKTNFNIDSICLPDRPVKGLFKFLNDEEANDLYKKYKELNELVDSKGKKTRPIVMISSTSWTPDEDFGMLLNGFIKTEEMIRADPQIKDIKKVLFLITGRGPMREEFMAKVSRSNLRIFDVKTIWLDSDDYPKLLSLVDLGISLHYSSSGMDLPMKVVDMFSACLPVAAVYYPTINELVKKEKNGFLIKSDNDLCTILKTVIEDFSKNGHCDKIDTFRKNLTKSLDENDWVTQWGKEVKPKIQKF